MSNEGKLESKNAGETWFTLVNPVFCLVAGLMFFAVGACGVVIFGEFLPAPFYVALAVSLASWAWGVIIGFVRWRRESSAARWTTLGLLIWLVFMIFILPAL